MWLTLNGPYARADNPFDAWARMITDPEQHDRGPRVPFPDAPLRPAAVGWLRCSLHEPVCVQAPARVEADVVERAVVALERAYEWLQERGWPLPYPDGGAGATPAFDLYLEPNAELYARAYAETRIAWTDLDAATTYGVLGGAPPADELGACMVSMLAQAGLLAEDPAEPAPAREASAAWVAWQFSGELGCGDNRDAAQAAASEGPVGPAREQVANLALWLARIARRLDAGGSDLLREVWEVARQRSGTPGPLRARRDFWQALDAVLVRAHESLEDAAVELAVARWFWPDAEPDPSLPSLHGARVPAVTLAASDLSRGSPEQALRAYGSAYLMVELSDVPATQLRAWLRGEADGRFALRAVRLDARGRDLGQVAAPAGPRSNGFLPVDLTSDTRRVLWIVTRLPQRRPHPPYAEDLRSYRLLFETR